MVDPRCEEGGSVVTSLASTTPIINVPLVVCGHPGCSAVTSDGGLCAEHRKNRGDSGKAARVRQRYRDRGTSSERGYDIVWQRLRKMVLAKEPLCRACKASGRLTVATVVDHIIPMSAGGENDDGNLQPLCKPCHDSKTYREDGSLGKKKRRREAAT